MSKPEGKILYECRTKCPWCSKLIRAKVMRTTISPGVKAEMKIEEFVEKDTQTTLEQDYQDEYSPPKKKVKRKGY